jgi:hypothetical protein
MKNKIKIIAISIILSTGIFVGTVQTQSANANTTATVSMPSAPVIQYINVNALELVSNPYRYLRRNVRVRGKFDKFSTLGLDYPSAMRSHEKYISFMIQRPDITNHNIPLSEFKIFLKKEVAEKYIDLDAGDEVEFTGKIFSTALGDPWMDVDDFKVINKVKKDTKK